MDLPQTVLITKGNPLVVRTKLASVMRSNAERGKLCPLSFRLQFVSVLQIDRVRGAEG